MVERASPVIRETTASPPPAGRSPLARREHPPPAFVKLRADHVPAIANRIFIDHAIRDTSVRLDPESRRPESTRRTPAHRDSLIVRGGLSRQALARTYDRASVRTKALDDLSPIERTLKL